MSSRKPASSLDIPEVIYVTNDVSSTSFLTTGHVARYLGVKPDVLRQWRRRLVGPRWVKFPGLRGAVLYPEAAVLSYVAARLTVTERMAKPSPGPILGKPQQRKRRSSKCQPTSSVV
jgi:hypothetical protein